MSARRNTPNGVSKYSIGVSKYSVGLSKYSDNVGGFACLYTTARKNTVSACPF